VRNAEHSNAAEAQQVTGTNGQALVRDNAGGVTKAAADPLSQGDPLMPCILELKGEKSPYSPTLMQDRYIGPTVSPLAGPREAGGKEGPL
jgi:hypothetical protein